MERFRSSENRIILTLWKRKDKSYINMMKRNGPKWEPWGTPDYHFLSLTRHCLLLSEVWFIFELVSTAASIDTLRLSWESIIIYYYVLFIATINLTLEHGLLNRKDVINLSRGVTISITQSSLWIEWWVLLHCEALDLERCNWGLMRWLHWCEDELIYWSGNDFRTYLGAPITLLESLSQ